MKHAYLKLSLLFLAILSLCGCATVLTGTMQTIHIKVIDADTCQPLDCCRCTVTDGNGGTYAVVGNPATVKVCRGQGPILVECKKEGYRQLNTAVGDSFNAVTLVNVLFWPGFIVDAISGCYKKYPSHYVVTMEKIKEPACCPAQ